MSAIRSSFIRAAAKAGRRTTPSIISRQAVRAFTTTPQANDYEAIHEKEIPATKFQPGKFQSSLPNIKAACRFQYFTQLWSPINHFFKQILRLSV